MIDADKMISFDLNAALAGLGMRQMDLQRLAGANRSTVYRWRSTKRCPQYVLTIVAQQRIIRNLAGQLAA